MTPKPVKPKTMQCGARIAVDLWRAVRIAAIERGLKPKEAVTEALTAWLEKK